MQKEQVKLAVMAIISAYLVYTGFELVRDYDPAKNIIYLIAGILFVAFGGFALIIYIRRIVRARREEEAQAEEDAGREDQ